MRLLVSGGSFGGVDVVEGFHNLKNQRRGFSFGGRLSDSEMGAVASYVSPPSSSSSPSRGGASATHLAVRPSVQCSGIRSQDLDRAARLGDMKKDQLRFKRTFATSKFHTSSNFFPACYWIRMKRSRTG